MASEPTTGAPWHLTLAEQDARAHDRMAEAARAAELDLMQRRLDGLAAEVTVLRAGVDRRSRLLQRQSLALAERDARIRLLETALGERGGWAAAPLEGLRRLRAWAGRPRRGRR